MPLTHINIMTNVGVAPAASRNAIIANFSDGGLADLVHLSDADVKDAMTSHVERSDGDFPATLTQSQKQRMRALALWVKDKDRREKMRKEQRKVGESYHDHLFNNKLKTQSQWDKFHEELESTLGLIIGSQGCPLTHVICKEEAAEFDDTTPFEEAVIQAVALTGPKFKADARTVHQIILNDVDENLDACTCIKPLSRCHDGRRDVAALWDRHSGDAAKQAIIVSAKVVLKTIRCKSERNFNFEKFSAKLQRVYDKLAEHGRPVHNADIVEESWPRIQDSSLQTYIASLKVDFQKNPRDHKLILQDIAAEVASNEKTDSNFISGNSRNVGATHTQEEADNNFDPDSFDAHLNMKLLVKRSDQEHPQFARVTKKLQEHRGNPIGAANDDPTLDTRMHEVEFANGQKQAMAANIIAENVFASVDEEGHRHLLLDSIVDCRKMLDAIEKKDAFATSSNGTKRRRETTKAHQMRVQWKDGSATWSKMKDVKDSHPAELAEFVVNDGIADEPAFAWWVPFTLKKKARTISKIKSEHWQRTHKHGVRMPKSVAEAIALDTKNGNTLWWDALMQEMKNVRPAFEVCEGDTSNLVGCQHVKCHIVWDVKSGENFWRKARLVAGGHATDAPSSVTCSLVVSRDSVRLALTTAALNNLNMLACDIQNAHLTADCREKTHAKAGPEFSSEAGKAMIVKKALCGLKSTGAAFRALLANKTWDLGCRPSKADPDVWLKPAVKGNGFNHCDMVLCCNDDVISITENLMHSIEGTKAAFKLKGDKAEAPDNAIGTKCWTLSSEKCVKTAVANVQEKLAESGLRLPSKCTTPFASGCNSSEDTSGESDTDGVRHHQELIGVLRWAIELGRVDMLLEVSLLSTHLALPWSGHLQQLHHIFGHLQQSPRRRLFFDPDHPNIKESGFQKFDWLDFHKGAEEDIPFDMPEPRGNEVSIHCFVDASHASDKENGRSQTGILIFVNYAFSSTLLLEAVWTARFTQ